MFRIYKHNIYSEYRLLIPQQAQLPRTLRKEWTLDEVTDQVEAAQQEWVNRSGYYLVRSECNQPL